MGKLTEAYANFEKRLIQWGEQHNDVRALLVIGSRTRTNHPADEWSDMDVILFVTNPDPYIASGQWLNELGEVWLSYTEPIPIDDGAERRVLFAGAVEVDFIPVRMAAQTLASPVLHDILSRGFRPLLDKDQVAGQLPQPPETTTQPLPDEVAFGNVVNGFWHHTVWSAKKLRRGELWTGLGALNSFMIYSYLLPMIEWHTLTVSPEEKDIWFRGRFLEEWADPQVVAALTGVYAHYDYADAWRALDAWIDLFRRIATATAAELGYTYPEDTDRNITAWLTEIRPDKY